MNEIDREALEYARNWAKARLHAHERRKQMAPMMEAMSSQVNALTNSVMPDFMVDAVARVRESTLAMEKSAPEHQEKMREAEDRKQKVLASTRRRTQSLRELLEAVS